MHATCSGQPTSFDLIISTIPSGKAHIYEATLPDGVKRKVTVLNGPCEIRLKINDKRKEEKRMTQRERDKFVTRLRISRPVISGTRSFENLTELT